MVARLLHSYVATRILQICSLSKFAGDIKLREVVYLLNNKVSIQSNLEKTVYWGQQNSYDIEYRDVLI